MTLRQFCKEWERRLQTLRYKRDFHRYQLRFAFMMSESWTACHVVGYEAAVAELKEMT